VDLSFNAEQQELIEAVRRFAAEQVTPERLAAWEASAEGVDDAFWERVAQLGWLGIGLPADAGGSGLGLVEVACLLCECSRGLIPLAVAAAIRAADALTFLDATAPELAGAAAGKTRLALAVDEEHAGEPSAFTCALDGDKLTGSKWYVQHAERADFFLVAARHLRGLALALAPRESVQLEPLRPFAGGDVQSIVRFARTPVVRLLCAPEEGETRLAQLRRRQTALALAEMVGGMEAILEKTVAYVKEREQFGQKIGVFQAVQHQIADMATAHRASRHLAWQAITRIAGDCAEPIDLPAAAAYVGAAFKQLAVTGHHLHGGAGFVVEHPLHYYSERAQSLCIRYTPEGSALAEVAAVLLD
jgi:hypothetical protein